MIRQSRRSHSQSFSRDNTQWIKQSVTSQSKQQYRPISQFVHSRVNHLLFPITSVKSITFRLINQQRKTLNKILLDGFIYISLTNIFTFITRKRKNGQNETSQAIMSHLLQEGNQRTEFLGVLLHVINGKEPIPIRSPFKAPKST